MILFKKYKAIVYLPNVYTLLQYKLLDLYKFEDTIFFFHEKYPPTIIHRVPNSILLKETSVGRIYSLLIIYWFLLRNRNISVFLGGSLFFTDFFLRFYKHISYLEDGLASYESIMFEKGQVKHKAKNILRRILIGDHYPWFGLAENVEYNYLTGILPIPDIITDKTVIIDLKLLWRNKSTKQKNEILDIFLSKDIDFKMMNSCETLLLTQPMDGAKEFTELDKIEVYRRLLSSYDESKVIIKSHPTDKTDYLSYFPSAKIINTPCPMELLTLLGISFKRAITINSTAIYSISDSVEKIIAGYNVTPALMEEAKRRGFDKGISVKMNNNSKK